VSEQIFLGLGSNRGDRARYLFSALERISGLPGTELLRASSVYETEPVGKTDQSLFLNMVVQIRSALSPGQLIAALKNIEISLGRGNTERWGPREIDIDVIYYGATIVANEGLSIPHPERAGRLFVLMPLAELDDSFLDPELKLTVKDLVTRCPKRQGIVKTEIEFNLPSLES